MNDEFKVVYRDDMTDEEFESHMKEIEDSDDSEESDKEHADEKSSS